MKDKSSIFVATSPKSFFRNKMSVAIFMAICWLLSAKIQGYQSPVSYCILCRNLTLASWGKVAFLHLFTFIFLHEMPKSEKNQSSVNNSTATLTSTGTKSVEISQLFNPKFIEFTRQLGAMRDWLDVYREEFARDDEQVHRHLIDAESLLYEVSREFSAMLAIEFREKVYFKNI